MLFSEMLYASPMNERPSKLDSDVDSPEPVISSAPAAGQLICIVVPMVGVALVVLPIPVVPGANEVMESSKFAFTVLAASTVTLHVLVPEQPLPLHPVN